MEMAFKNYLDALVGIHSNQKDLLLDSERSAESHDPTDECYVICIKPGIFLMAESWDYTVHACHASRFTRDAADSILSEWDGVAENPVCQGCRIIGYMDALKMQGDMARAAMVLADAEIRRLAGALGFDSDGDLSDVVARLESYPYKNASVSTLFSI